VQGVKEGTENKTGPDRTSPNINPQPQASNTCTYNNRENQQRAWNMKEREREIRERQNSEKDTFFS